MEIFGSWPDLGFRGVWETRRGKEGKEKAVGMRKGVVGVRKLDFCVGSRVWEAWETVGGGRRRK